MTDLDRKIRSTQHRLWANSWFERTAWTLTAGAGAFAAVTLFDRLYDAGLPLGLVTLGILAAALVAGSIWTLATRTSREQAAACLDEAAGLRERVSSGLYCRQDAASLGDDPFARAVVEDAERTSGMVTVRMHVRLRAPFAAVYAVLASGLAALLLLVPAGLLVRDAVAQGPDNDEVQRAKVEVRRKLDEVKKVAQTNPALKDLEKELENLDRMPAGKMDSPDKVRHEAIKKIDKLSDALRERQKDEEFKKLQQFRKLMRSVKGPQNAKTPVEKMRNSLAQGDFKGARQQLKDLQEKLAKAESKEDKERLQAMKNQLDELAKKLTAAADDKELRQKLQQAGVKKEDLERMLQRLTKKDLDQLRKQLQDQGMTQEQIEKIAQQMKDRQQACQACQQMAQAMSQAAQAAAAGDMASAAAQLDAAAGQLSEMEMLEQELNQIQAAMSEMQSAANSLDGSNQGQGGGTGRGSGQGQQPGQGQGSLAMEEQTASGFKTHRQKVHVGKGAIIGQYLTDAQQVKGEVSKEVAEVMAAEERVAADLIYEQRIPRQYQSAIKDYFSLDTVERVERGGDGEAAAENQSASDQADDASN